MITYKENALKYEDYYKLRESVNWLNFSPEQTKRALKNSIYSITVYDDEYIIAMGRLIGDGMYYIVVDIIVCPEYQGNGIGTQILNRILRYVEEATPENGRASVQLIAEKGKESFYQKFGFKLIPYENCGSGMRKVIYKINQKSSD